MCCKWRAVFQCVLYSVGLSRGHWGLSGAVIWFTGGRISEGQTRISCSPLCLSSVIQMCFHLEESLCSLLHRLFLYLSLSSSFFLFFFTVCWTTCSVRGDLSLHPSVLSSQPRSVCTTQGEAEQAEPLLTLQASPFISICPNTQNTRSHSLPRPRQCRHESTASPFLPEEKRLQVLCVSDTCCVSLLSSLLWVYTLTSQIRLRGSAHRASDGHSPNTQPHHNVCVPQSAIKMTASDYMILLLCFKCLTSALLRDVKNDCSTSRWCPVQCDIIVQNIWCFCWDSFVSPGPLNIYHTAAQRESEFKGGSC